MGEPGKFSDTMTSYQWRSHVDTSCSHDGMIADAVRRCCQGWNARSSRSQGYSHPPHRRPGNLVSLFPLISIPFFHETT